MILYFLFYCFLTLCTFLLLICECIFLPRSMSVNLASAIAASDSLLFHLISEVSTHGLLFFCMQFSHFFTFVPLICACVMPLSMSVDLASHVAAADALLFLGIPQVSLHGCVLCFLHAGLVWLTHLAHVCCSLLFQCEHSIPWPPLCILVAISSSMAFLR